MKPSDRIKIISEIANSLAPADYSLIDLTLRQFGLSWTEQWYGNKIGYVLEMIQTADDQSLLDLASHLGINPVDDIGKETLAYSEAKELIQGIDKQKALMIDVATGGSRIQQVNDEYKARRISIISRLQVAGIQDPNPYSDLWNWFSDITVRKLGMIALPLTESRIAAFSRLSPSTVSKLRAIAQYLTVLQKLVSGGELSWFPGFQGFDDVMVMLNEGICESDRS